jgi:predicted GH43/DUF377 family glycosyl hydrolase
MRRIIAKVYKKLYNRFSPNRVHFTAIEREIQQVLVQTTPVLCDLPNCTSYPLKIDNNQPVFNPALVFFEGNLIFILRRSSGMAIRDNSNEYTDNLPHNTVNYMYVCGFDGKCTSCEEVDDSLTRYQSGFAELGIEDIRLFVHDNELFGICAGISSYGNNNIRVTQILIKFSGNKIIWYKVLPFPIASIIEKNWMPLSDGGKLFLVYSLDPLVCYEVEDGNLTLKIGKLPETNNFNLRGGSPFVKINGKYLSIAHYAPLCLDKKYYRHCFVVLDESLKLVETSTPFFLMRRGIEFALGLVVTGDTLLISYGVSDRSAFYLRMHVDDLKRYIVTV